MTKKMKLGSRINKMLKSAMTKGENKTNRSAEKFDRRMKSRAEKADKRRS